MHGSPVTAGAPVGDNKRMSTSSAPSESRRLFSSTVALIGGRLITAVFGWAGSVIIARSLAGDDWGRYSFVFALLGLLDVVTDLGVGRVVLARLNSRNPDEAAQIAGSFFVLRALLGLIGFTAAVGYAWAVGLSPLVMAATAFAGTTVLLATPANALFVLYQSRLRLTFVAAGDIVGQMVQFLLIVVVALLHPALLMFIIPAVVREVVVIVWRAVGVPRLLEPEFRPTFRRPTAYWGEMLREAIPLSFGFALLHLLERIDTLMLQQMDTYDAVGKYAIGYKFSDLLALVVSSLAVPFTTVLISSWPDRPAAFRARFQQAVVIAAVLAGLAVTAFTPAARPVISLLYGIQYAGGAPAAVLLVIGAGFSGVTYVVVSSLIAARKLKVFPVIAAVGLVLNVVLNYILIPLRSIVGAATATVITEVVMLVAMLLVLQWSLRVPRLIPWGKMVRMVLLVGAVTVPATLLTDDLNLHWIPVVGGAVLVFTTLWALAERRTSAMVLHLLRERLGGSATAPDVEEEPHAFQ